MIASKGYYLVLAVGAQPRYFGNDELERYSFPLTSVQEALAIRDRVIGAYERVSLIRDPAERAPWLTFVVAGAGPAGVEVASEIHGLANNVPDALLPGSRAGSSDLVALICSSSWERKTRFASCSR